MTVFPSEYADAPMKRDDENRSEYQGNISERRMQHPVREFAVVLTDDAR
jgi:hypothetical protein